MRIISPKLDKKSGELYHYCPLDGSQITFTTCESCEYLGEIEELTRKYKIHCNAPGNNLIEFEPPKAYDEHQGKGGMDLLEFDEYSWIEPKLDGVRALVHITPDGVFITSRRRNKFGEYQQFQDNIPQIRDHPDIVSYMENGYTVLDGEIMMPVDSDTLAITMGVIGSKPERAIELQEKTGLAVLNVFDMPYANGYDYTDESFDKRRAMLDSLLHQSDLIKLVPGHSLKGESRRANTMAWFVDYTVEQGLEGIVLKNPALGYFDTHAWLKVKKIITVDAIITGWDYGDVGTINENVLSRMKISVVDSVTEKLREIAIVGPGDEKTQQKMHDLLTPLSDEEIRSLELIVELQSQEWTKTGRLRHPRIMRYRVDKNTPNSVNFSLL